jgi:hypothetical protein
MAYLIGSDRVLEVSASSPGVGGVLLGGAVPGFRTFSSVMANNDTCAYYIEAVDSNGVPTGLWERGYGTYSSSNNSLARNLVADSTNGPNYFNTFSTNVRCGSAPMSDTSIIYPAPGGRLTLTQNAPVADTNGSNWLYYAPYLHDKIPLWNGYGIEIVQFPAGANLNLTSGGANTQANTAYDVFGYRATSGLLGLELVAWTSPNTRSAVGLTYQNGFICKSTDPTRRYLGSIFTHAAGVAYDIGNGGANGAGGKRMVWNYNNRVIRDSYMYDNSAAWTYASGVSRVIRGSVYPNDGIELMRGINEEPVSVNSTLSGSFPVNTGLFAGVAFVQTPNTTPTANNWSVSAANTGSGAINFSLQINVQAKLSGGYVFMAMMENANYSATVNLGSSYGLVGLYTTFPG